MLPRRWFCRVFFTALSPRVYGVEGPRLRRYRLAFTPWKICVCGVESGRWLAVGCSRCGIEHPLLRFRGWSMAVSLHVEARRKGGRGQVAAYLFRLLVSAALRASWWFWLFFCTQRRGEREVGGRSPRICFASLSLRLCVSFCVPNSFFARRAAEIREAPHAAHKL